LAIPAPYWKDVDYKYQLQFGGGTLERLEVRPYLNKASTLDVHDNLITNVELQSLKQLQHAKEIRLDGNKLEILPREVSNFTKFEGKLSLYGNPWNCSHGNQWLQVWMRQIEPSLSLPYSILCSYPPWLSGQSLLNADFSAPDPSIQQKRVIVLGISTIVGSVFIFFCSLFVLYKARVWIFTRFDIRVFSEWDDSTEGRYDAFIAFAWDDYAKVREVADLLEEKHGFQCCVHNRDFNPAMRFLDMMAEAIEESRRTICFLSPNFLQSEYCIREFRQALERDREQGKMRLAAVLLEPLDCFDDNNRVVEKYIKSHTYLDIHDEDFEHKLLYIMPTKREMNTDDENESTPLLGT
jgi:hypothetical protein